MSLTLITPPQLEPISLEEAKLYLRLSGKDEDTLIQSFIIAARQLTENLTGHVLLKQTWKLAVKPLRPRRSPLVQISDKHELIIHLPHAPFSEIVEIKVCDQKVKSYHLDTENRVVLPFAFYDKDLEVVYTAGYGETRKSLPELFKLAIKMCVASFYQERGTNINAPFIKQLYLILKPFRTNRLI